MYCQMSLNLPRRTKKRLPKQDKFRPENEEDIQCFLYHGLILELGTAIGIKPKPTTAKPEKPVVKGVVNFGDMHFPDIMLGNDELVVEIKFARNGSVPYQKCRDDITKMNKYHPNALRYFILYDKSADHIFLDEHQLNELQELARDKCAEGRECRILRHPEKLNPSPVKAWGRKAWETMKNKKKTEGGKILAELGRTCRVRRISQP